MTLSNLKEEEVRREGGRKGERGGRRERGEGREEGGERREEKGGRRREGGGRREKGVWENEKGGGRKVGERSPPLIHTLLSIDQSSFSDWQRGPHFHS